jgi:predicted O-methyltransferase YrrM
VTGPHRPAPNRPDSHRADSHRPDPIDRIRSARARLAADGPPRVHRPGLGFARVSLPARDADLLRDALIAERARTVVEVGLAYAASALAIAEALAGADRARHIVIDPFQAEAYDNAGWETLTAAGARAELVTDWSSVALPRLLAAGLVADAAFVDGSHRFHEVFLDLYYLRKIVRPGGLIILDDDCVPPVRAAVRYFEENLGWRPVPAAFAAGTQVGGRARCLAVRLPDSPFEPRFEDFRPFWP